MNLPSEDIKDLLTSDSFLDLEFGRNLFIGKEPLQPDICVTIFDVSGSAPDLMMDARYGYQRPQIQIRVRANDYTVGARLIQDIFDSLHNKGNLEINSTFYTVIRASTSPFFFDWDDKNRSRFVVTFETQRRT